MDTYMEAFSINKEKKSYSDFEIEEDVQQKIMEMRETLTEDQIYDIFSKSIAPEIFGMEDIKKALLLLMSKNKKTNNKIHFIGQLLLLFCNNVIFLS